MVPLAETLIHYPPPSRFDCFIALRAGIVYFPAHRVHYPRMARKRTPPPSTQAPGAQQQSATALDAESVVRRNIEARESAARVLGSEDDMSMLRWLEARGNSVPGIDPLSDEGLRLQALYVQSFSQHPLDVMRRIMENPFSEPRDRMSAAKAIMEYSLRKPTQQLALDAKGVGLSIDASQLANLSTQDLDMLEKLLSKATGGNGG